MVAATPKFKSSEFKDALVALKQIFDAHSLSIVLLDALDRKAAEQIYARIAGSAGKAHLSSLPKMDLVGQITGYFFANEEVAFQLTKEMDRACLKERHIVASIPTEQAKDRIGSYRAIAFKRERAKLVWALSRDDREEVRLLANQIIRQFFEEVAELETARAVAEGKAAPRDLGDDVEVARKLKDQAERLGDAVVELTELQSKLSEYEEERARLLAEMGAKERLVKQHADAREELDQQLKALRCRLDELEATQREAEVAKESEREARAAAEDLAQKVRRLEKLAGAADSLSVAQSELDLARRRIDELARSKAKEAQVFERERESRDREMARLREELDQTREELHRARKQIAALEHGALPNESVAPSTEDHRVAILLDQANLAATAAQSFGRKVNFSALLPRLSGNRKVVRAVAFVVDNGGVAFDAFCDTLRRTGWELRVKRPKRFADGRSKADWDMGLAMEAIDLHDRADTLVLASGDGDFAPLVRRLQRFGVQVEVASFSDGLSQDLVSTADAVVRLDPSLLE